MFEHPGNNKVVLSCKTVRYYTDVWISLAFYVINYFNI